MTTLNINKLSPLQLLISYRLEIISYTTNESRRREILWAGSSHIDLTVYINIVAIPTLNINKLSPLQLLISYRLEIIELWVSNWFIWKIIDLKSWSDVIHFSWMTWRKKMTAPNDLNNTSGSLGRELPC